MAGKAEVYARMLKLRMDQRREILSEDIRQIAVHMTGIEARIARLQRGCAAYDAVHDLAAHSSGVTGEAE